MQGGIIVGVKLLEEGEGKGHRGTREGLVLTEAEKREWLMAGQVKGDRFLDSSICPVNQDTRPPAEK